MLERLLIAGLALLVPNQSHKLQNSEENVIPTEAVLIEKVYEEEIDQIKSAAVFHVVLLAISLTVCLAYGGILAYTHWTQKNDILGHIKNLVIALFCRIFFTVIFDGVVILGSDTSAEGRNTLVAFECISQNLVFAFWLLLTVYLHARIQRNFNSEPTLKLFEYGIPGAAIFFAFVSICALPAELYNKISFFFLSPLPLWLSASLRLLYLLIQLGLVADMGKIMMKTSLDNDSVSLLKKLLAVLVVLVFLFWLQFGFSIGRLPLKAASYYYFDFLIDGSQGGLVCLALYLFHKWVPTFLSTVPSTVTGIEERPKQTDEVLLRSGRGVLTVDSLFVREDERMRKNSDPAASRDVVYSSVVEPHRLQKTLELYKRLNVISKNQVTVVEGEEFFDCLTRVSIDSEIGNSEKAEFQSIVSENSKPQPLPRKTSAIFKMSKTDENIQKKNAFYASKYLILEPKGNNLPKNLERQLSVASSGKEGIKETMDKKFSLGIDTVKSSEIVKKWLDDHSENLRAVGKPEIQPPCQEPTSTSEKEDEPNQTAAASTMPGAMLDLNKEESSSNQNTEIPSEAEVSPGKLSANNTPKVISVRSEELDKSNHSLNNKSDDYNSSDLTGKLKTEIEQPKTNSDIIQEFHPSVRNPISIENYNSPETNTYSEAGLNSEGGTCGEKDHQNDNKTAELPSKNQLIPTQTSYTATDSKTGEDNFHSVNEQLEVKPTNEQSLKEHNPLHNSLVEEMKQNIFC